MNRQPRVRDVGQPQGAESGAPQTCLRHVEERTDSATQWMADRSHSQAEKIRNPKRLIDKLGVKPDQRVSVTGIDDAEFLEQLAERTANASIGRIAKGSVAVFLGVESVADLARIAKAASAIARNGMVWVVWPKGRPALKEDHVRAAALKAGLVDVKVAAFSPTLSALKLVIPVAKR